ncbi:acyl transferase domain-containing protein [Allocatelliglobosispora scoriae]|uniref:Acyl transferase domain-containing protein n=1 Tax=Allocatelliglobosispora scoriae TaxID=643052 RepID=A0A841C3F0_9ACTN|nr:acyltransferase domain-containing protein [Allocatelliglobosispora scoriae]MBB5873480.1 acyl transferase domain-containing protein [Allocatelliglobosispora scoriae]
MATSDELGEDPSVVTAGLEPQVRTAPGRRTRTEGPLVWVLSARSEAALRAQAGRLRDYVALASVEDLAAAGHELSRLTALDHRAAVVADDRDGLLAGFTALAAGAAHPGVTEGVAGGDVRPVFVFPGHGPQWAEMAAELLETNEVFWEWMCRCDGALAEHIDWSVLDVLRQEDGAPELHRSDVIQPVLFAVMVCLAALWRSLGVEPTAVIGHSHGETAAACVAGALSLEDGAKIVALRSKALTRLRGTGGMVVVALSADRARELIAPWSDRLWVAVFAGPACAVVAGEVAALDEFAAACADTVALRRIRIDCALHTPHIDALDAELLELLAGVTPLATEVVFASSVAGAILPSTDLTTGYWVENLSRPVRFDAAVTAVAGLGNPLFIEVSPHPVLGDDVRDILRDADLAGATCSTLHRESGDWRTVVAAAARAHVLGARVDWPTVLDQPSPPHTGFDQGRFRLATDGSAPQPASLTDESRSVSGKA